VDDTGFNWIRLVHLIKCKHINVKNKSEPKLTKICVKNQTIMIDCWREPGSSG
jgi:hypothetical protein